MGSSVFKKGKFLDYDGFFPIDNSNNVCNLL